MEEISSLQQEKNILQHMERLKQDPENSEVNENKNDSSTTQLKKFVQLPPGQRPPSRRPPPTKKGLNPVIITKDLAMKQVFGAGYPSLPVLTVDEFYEQRVKQGK